MPGQNKISNVEVCRHLGNYSIVDVHKIENETPSTSLKNPKNLNNKCGKLGKISRCVTFQKNLISSFKEHESPTGPGNPVESIKSHESEILESKYVSEKGLNKKNEFF